MGLAGSCPRLVGRADELAVLERAFATVQARLATTVLVTAEAGGGKSRVVQEFTRSPAVADALVLRGASSPLDAEGVPYGALRAVMRDLCRRVGPATLRALGGDHVSHLALLVPALAGSDDATAREASKAALFEAVFGCLSSLAERCPVVVVVEDLHWGDSGTAQALDFLARNLTDERVLLVLTARSDEAARDHSTLTLLAELARHERTVSLPLRNLDRDAVSDMIAAIIGARPPRSLVDTVFRRSQGLPFFVEELVATAHEGGVPPELQRIVLLRTDRLSPPASEVLRAASVAGDVVDHDMLAALVGLDDDVLDCATGELVDSQILAIEPEGDAYRFRHALTQEAVYGQLRPGERRRLHARAAAWMSAGAHPGGSDADRRVAVGIHHWKAGAWEEALDASLDAADRADAVLASGEAHAHVERAVDAWERLPVACASAHIDRLALLERACEAAHVAEAPLRAVEHARAALAHLGPDDLAARALWLGRLGRSALSAGDHAAALDAFEQAADVLPDAASPERARVLAEAARLVMLLSHFEDGQQRAALALETARAVGVRLEEAHAITTLGCCRFSLGRVDEGLELLRQGLSIALELRSPEALGRAYGNLSAMTLVAGRLEEAARWVREGLALAAGADGAWLATAATNGARALVKLGRWQEAEELLHAIPTASLELSGCAHLSYAAIHLRRGRLDLARSSLAVADDRSSGVPDVMVRGWYHSVAAELAIAEARHADAVEEIERAMDLEAGTEEVHLGPELRALGIRALVDEATDARARNVRPRLEPDKTRLVVAQLAAAAADIVAAPVARGGVAPPEAEAFTLQCRAEASRLDGSDPELWDATAERWRSLEQPYQYAYARWREAEARLGSHPERARAAASLTEAWHGAVALGARPLVDEIERLARRGRIDLVDDTPGPPEEAAAIAKDLGVTRRELEVLRCLARGDSDRQIAERLFISKKTASVHVSNLLRKLGVANRVEAGDVGQRAGLA